MRASVLYKLTDKDGRARGVQWGENVTRLRTTIGSPCKPCTAAALHAYTDPLLAVVMDPVHGDYGPTARMFTARMIVAGTDGVKVWGRRLTTIEEIPLPVVTTEQRVRFGILCGLAIYDEPRWVAWAHGWLDGSDRAAYAAYAAADGGAYEAACAAYAAVYAADEAAYEAAYWAADAAGRAAADGVDAAIDFVAIAHEAVEGTEHE